MVLTKAELVHQLGLAGFNKTDALQMVELCFEEIRVALERGDEVKLSGFGNFSVRSKKERPGRNPRTGEVAVVKARRVVTFHASQKLKAKIDGIKE